MKLFFRIALALGAVSTCHAVSLINLNFSGEMTPIQRQTFIDAADFWNSAITGYDLIHDSNGVVTPHGLTITASIPSIDGVNGVLGSAGPETLAYYDNNPIGAPTMALFYTNTGLMRFDSADVSEMVDNNTFYGVVLHEMAHVLGIGTLWAYNSNVNDTNYPLYVTNSGQYTGPNALAQYRDEFNALAEFVPVELGGGDGTANGHWNENDGGGGLTNLASNDNGEDFSRELMTGWASDTFFLSRTTLGSLDDLGYTVDYSKAGIVNHVVTVPEISSIALVAAAAPWMLRRRRKSSLCS